MRYKFDPHKQLIVAKAKLLGPAGDIVIEMALDTGASSTLIGWHALQLVGYNANDAVEQVEMTTGSGIEHVPRIKVRRIEAFGKRRIGLGVVGHTLPKSASVDGLLGLDFLRECRLTIDFLKSTVKIDWRV